MVETHIANRAKADDETIKPRLKSVAQWIWICTAIIGICIFINAALNIQRMFACDQWPSTDGVIVRSELKRGFMREGALKFRFNLVYRYQVEGHNYAGRRISFTRKSKNRENIESLLAAYPRGGKVKVHYLPTNPNVATLEIHTSWKEFKSLFGGLLLLYLGLAGMWRRWSLQTDYLFRDWDPDQPIAKWKMAAGLIGLTACLSLFWLWWELIKMYAGR